MAVFISTRNKEIRKNSSEAIIHGLSEDGGLYVMEEIPKIRDLYSFRNCAYKELAGKIITMIFDDLDPDLVQDVCLDAYSRQFDTEEIVPLRKVKNDYYLELYHGPTSAFKDIALQFLPRIMTRIRKDDKDIVILSATSGDTGKAALEGFKDVAGTRIKVLYPYKMVSLVQERQMSSTGGDNTEVLALKGNFDDCQKMVKDILENEKIDAIHLSSANSINIARLVPQIVYYFKAYFDLFNNNEIKKDESIDFVVPTGNFGDILAGYIAKEMGLPVHKLILAANENNVLEDFIKTGIYDSNRPLINTISPSIDILISSNLERLLYLKCKDTNQIRKYYEDLKNTGRFEISNDLLRTIQDDFVALSVNQDEVRKVIRNLYSGSHYLIDTHTAVASFVSEKINDGHKKVILSTASPYKFAKDVYKAITGETIPDDLNAMERLYELTHIEIPEPLSKLKNLAVRFEEIIEKDDRKLLIKKLEERR